MSIINAKISKRPNCKPPVHAKRAFTLIELLIVVAIIAILAAIAVPNFLEAQTRSKIARVNSDMRTASIAIESYYVDSNGYPPSYWTRPYGQAGNSTFPRQLTSPISYLSSQNIFLDPFKLRGTATFSDGAPRNPYTQLFYDYKLYNKVNGPEFIGAYEGIKPQKSYIVVEINDIVQYPDSWKMTSFGPDQKGAAAAPGVAAYVPYDSTNGTISWGDVYRFGP